ncbi:MAG TPA: hypothetical protein VKS21_04380 [Spirochaetota bacterium]|nr:hypothetical protein [Spirochaetota bacterium]
MSENSTKTEKDNEAEFIYLKIILSSNKNNYFGIAFAKINSNTKQIEKIDSVISQYTQYLNNITLDTPWHAFIDFISDKKLSGDFAQKITKDIQDALEKELNEPKVIDDIIQDHQKKKFRETLENISPSIYRLLFDRKTNLQITTEALSAAQIDAHYQQQTNRTEETDTDMSEKSGSEATDIFDLSPENLLLDCSPVLSPVKGIPIFNLQPGMDIMLKILNNTEAGIEYNKKFELITPEGKILPKKATIIKINYQDEEYRILAKIDENIFARIVETEQVKIKPFQQEETEPQPDTEANTPEPARHTGLILLIAGGGILLFTIIFFIIMYII